ncbi:HugZ family pyridoxamine 5'-phosphate oxidase [Celeribacter litoreus]|uniref:HugZ family pyridoxamine 5'-phosphate oxidase n=1 Tax=Celeribacter litoreus TaxID=2876714 RepID=UPI001CCE7090|nr:pyridoxamine 5'-phosphate oxidase family protein [Celeribacter litoreus]MCA0044148.1 pyridoxamine 5'-phosphate oxidase family protein [Celeribacter litoreus]
MTEKPTSPIRPTDDDARALAGALVRDARIASLAFIAPDTGMPTVTRVAFGLGHDGSWLTLISSLSAHTRALKEDARVGLLLGEAPQKGDPLAFPRLSVSAEAAFIERVSDDHTAYRDAWLTHHPKAQLYVDFADFTFVRFTPLSADLNGGFGKAYHLTADDLRP